MSVTEQQRLHLFKTLEQRLGDEDAATMMELLPPVGWADVATKRDLDALEERLDLRLDIKLDGAANRLRRDVVTWLLAGMGIQTAAVGLLLGLTH